MYEWLKLIVNVGNHNIDGACGIISPCNYHLSCRLYMYSFSGLRPHLLKLWRFFFTPSPKKHTPSIHKVSPKNCEVPPIEFCRSRNEGKRCRPKMRDTPFLEKTEIFARAENSPSRAGKYVWNIETYIWVKFMVNAHTLQIQDY